MLWLVTFYTRLRLLVLVFSLTAIMAGCGGGVVILEGVTQDTANSVVLILGQNRIEADRVIRKDGTYNITVSSNNQIQALAILKANGQPEQAFTSLGEVFKKDGFISSPLEEQSRFIYALDQQISDMLSQFDGVISVHTDISLPAPSDNLWQTETVRPAASVLIKYKQGYRLDLYSNRIKQLVTNAVPGLTQDKVTVLTVPVSAIN
jgi:type III secretion protein J